ncbi:MAG: xanthine dehydrogenase family protein molybdopterin-binding subunit [Gemmatimonadetes bacterium]|nr:xanthine dehydrogenase family protein molybdopterin-binding subunit [Gemmatimonadota bacterium]
MSTPGALSRRDFFRVGAVAAAGSGLVLGVSLPHRHAPFSSPGTFAPNAFVRIGTDGAVTVMVGYSEMGQGIMTAVPMLVAEELEVDWTTVRFESAPSERAYYNPLFGMQGTGGSTTVRASWEPMRRAGAVAREMLIAAAAQAWGVDRATCRAENGTVVHASSGRRLTYGELATAAAAVPVPENVPLKPSSAWRVIGRPMKRLDAPLKVTGRAEFGIDVRLPGLLVAVVARCPVFGGRVRSFNAARARALPGVRHVVQISSGVAVVAQGYWQAKKGRDALGVTWDEGANANVSSAGITQLYADLARNPGAVARHEGDAAAALASAARRVEATYEVPYLAHATMEPMNCTAHVRRDGCDIWAPTQFQTASQGKAAEITGLRPETIAVHTTMLGGGFGRRAELDFVSDAVETSKAVGAPVKVIYSREDDIQHDYYRPATYNSLAGALDDGGWPVAWTHRIVGPSIFSRIFPQFVRNGIDDSSVEGAANLPYAIPNILVDYVMRETGVPVGFWRSVGNSQNAFIKESFLDELAAAGGKDPVELRRRLLANQPRHLGVLELAASRAGWGSPLPAGRARGIAVHESFGSYVAEVAEVSVAADGTPTVHRVVCAVDCGTVVNPLTVEAQMESGIVYGLSAALHGEITIDRGRVVQSNFHDYAPLRMSEVPRVEVHIVPSTEAPGGVGEPGTPPIAPAVCNAIFSATGRRIRRLPIRASA